MPAAVRLDGALRGLLNASAGPARQLPLSISSRRLSATRAVDIHANDIHDLHDREEFPSAYGNWHGELAHRDHTALVAAQRIRRGDEHICAQQVKFISQDHLCLC